MIDFTLSTKKRPRVKSNTFCRYVVLYPGGKSSNFSLFQSKREPLYKRKQTHDHELPTLRQYAIDSQRKQ